MGEQGRAQSAQRGTCRNTFPLAPDKLGAQDAQQQVAARLHPLKPPTVDTRQLLGQLAHRLRGRGHIATDVGSHFLLVLPPSPPTPLHQPPTLAILPVQ